MRDYSSVLEMTERVGVDKHPNLSKTAENIDGDSNIVLDFGAQM